MVVTKESTLGEILDQYPDIAPLFLEMGMHCLGCFASQVETLEEACMVHGLDIDSVMQDIFTFLELEGETP